MKVTILATRNCGHRTRLEKLLAEHDISHRVRFFDDHPEDVERFDLHASPNVMFEETVVFRATDQHRLPTEAEMQQIRDRLT